MAEFDVNYEMSFWMEDHGSKGLPGGVDQLGDGISVKQPFAVRQFTSLLALTLQRGRGSGEGLAELDRELPTGQPRRRT